MNSKQTFFKKKKKKRLQNEREKRSSFVKSRFNQKLFWRIVKTNVFSGCSDSRVFIHTSEWCYYFKSLLNDPNAAPISFQENTEYASPEADVLNSEITK